MGCKLLETCRDAAERGSWKPWLRSVPTAGCLCSSRIKADAHIRGYVGENVKLRCTFKSSSSITDKLTIDWTYRPPSSSRMESIFHYKSLQYPTTAGTFRDRISWVGDVYKGDASISISNPTVKDNGTFSCAVKTTPTPGRAP